MGENGFCQHCTPSEAYYNTNPSISEKMYYTKLVALFFVISSKIPLLLAGFVAAGGLFAFKNGTVRFIS